MHPAPPRTQASRHRPVVGALGTLAVAATLALTSCTTSPHPAVPKLAPEVQVQHTYYGAVQLTVPHTPAAPTSPAAAASVAAAERGFALALLRRLATPGENVAFSPASVAIALAMLDNGARGATETQLREVLQAGALTPAQLNAGWSALTRAWAKSPGVRLNSANSIWSQQGAQLEPAFVRALANSYGCGPWQADFRTARERATDAINKWVAGQTHGLIPKLFSQPVPPDTLLVLVNALSFEGTWATPFPAASTEPGPFTGSHGHRVVNYLSGPLSGAARTLVTPDLQVAQLPYTGNRFAATVLMPTHGALSNFVSGLTPAAFEKITAGLTPALDGSTVSLPKFTISSAPELMPALHDLGLRTVFGPDADLRGISPQAAYVSQLAHRAVVRVGERGTTAAAATGVVVGTAVFQGPPPHRITFDHPFLFLVRDTVTGAILFAVQVSDPQG